MEINKEYLDKINKIDISSTSYNNLTNPLNNIYSSVYTGYNTGTYPTFSRKSKFIKFKKNTIERGTKINPVIRDDLNYFNLELETFKSTLEIFKELNGGNGGYEINKLFDSEWL